MKKIDVFPHHVSRFVMLSELAKAGITPYSGTPIVPAELFPIIGILEFPGDIQFIFIRRPTYWFVSSHGTGDESDTIVQEGLDVFVKTFTDLFILPCAARLEKISLDWIVPGTLRPLHVPYNKTELATIEYLSLCVEATYRSLGVVDYYEQALELASVREDAQEVAHHLATLFSIYGDAIHHLENLLSSDILTVQDRLCFVADLEAIICEQDRFLPRPDENQAPKPSRKSPRKMFFSTACSRRRSLTRR